MSKLQKRHELEHSRFGKDMEAVPRSIAIAPPEPWQVIERNGFTIRVDPQRQSPLAFALSVAQGLDSRPRRLDASYLYDASGSALFERITEQPEYYLTRADRKSTRLNSSHD